MKSAQSDLDALEALFAEAKHHHYAAEAKAAQTAAATKHQPRRKAEKPLFEPPDAYFLNPANWTAGKGVAIIHEESQTLLGTMQEFLHVSGARKLVATQEPIAVSRTETVSGDWWIGKHHEIASPESWHRSVEVVVDLQMPCLGVFSPACPVVVHLSHGGIARVCLAVETQFAQDAAAPEQLLWLPAGTNVLPMLSQDCKIAVRVAVESEAAE